MTAQDGSTLRLATADHEWSYAHDRVRCHHFYHPVRPCTPEDHVEWATAILAALPPSAPPALTRDGAIDGWLRLYGGTDTDVAADVGRFYDEVIVPAAALPPNAPPVLDYCDHIVNNGEGEPTECGRVWPCEYHTVDR